MVKWCEMIEVACWVCRLQPAPFFAMGHHRLGVQSIEQPTFGTIVTLQASITTGLTFNKNSHKRITLAVGLLFGLCLPKLGLVIQSTSNFTSLNSGATEYVALTVGLSSKMPVQIPGHQHVIFPSQCGELCELWWFTWFVLHWQCFICLNPNDVDNEEECSLAQSQASCDAFSVNLEWPKTQDGDDFMQYKYSSLPNRRRTQPEKLGKQHFLALSHSESACLRGLGSSWPNIAMLHCHFKLLCWPRSPGSLSSSDLRDKEIHKSKWFCFVIFPMHSKSNVQVHWCITVFLNEFFWWIYWRTLKHMDLRNAYLYRIDAILLYSWTIIPTCICTTTFDSRLSTCS